MLDNAQERLTLDYQIKVLDKKIKTHFLDEIILEVKFQSSISSKINNILEKYQLTRKSFSKYGKGIEKVLRSKYE